MSKNIRASLENTYFEEVACARDLKLIQLSRELAITNLFTFYIFSSNFCKEIL